MKSMLSKKTTRGHLTETTSIVWTLGHLFSLCDKLIKTFYLELNIMISVKSFRFIRVIKVNSDAVFLFLIKFLDTNCYLLIFKA